MGFRGQHMPVERCLDIQSGLWKTAGVVTAPEAFSSFINAIFPLFHGNSNESPCTLNVQSQNSIHKTPDGLTDRHISSLCYTGRPQFTNEAAPPPVS